MTQHGPPLFPAPPAAPNAAAICYLRQGRSIRGRGVVVGCYANGSLRIQPTHRRRKQIVVTPMEISAAGAVIVALAAPRKETPALPVEVEPIQGSYWWLLWKHMHDEHGLILVESECADIAAAVDEARNDAGQAAALV